MHVFVTGSSGFAGVHLARELLAHGHRVSGFNDVTAPPTAAREVKHYSGDVRNATDVRTAVTEAAPDACVHLAALTSIAEGTSSPDDMLAVNVHGTLTLLNALRELCPAARVLVVSSSTVYRPSEGAPVREDAPLEPLNLYAASKAAADLSALAYARAYRMNVMTVRPTNHTGPGQDARFVVPAFAQQLMAIKDGTSASPLKVGNLESRRILLDVRDVVRAYRLLLEHGRPGLAYNLSAGASVPMSHVLERLCVHADVTPERVVDPDLYRPTDASPVLDTTRLREHTGWAPEIGLDHTLSDVLRAVAGKHNATSETASP